MIVDGLTSYGRLLRLQLEPYSLTSQGPEERKYFKTTRAGDIRNTEIEKVIPIDLRTYYRLGEFPEERFQKSRRATASGRATIRRAPRQAKERLKAIHRIDWLNRTDASDRRELTEDRRQQLIPRRELLSKRSSKKRASWTSKKESLPKQWIRGHSSFLNRKSHSIGLKKPLSIVI